MTDNNKNGKFSTLDQPVNKSRINFGVPTETRTEVLDEITIVGDSPFDDPPVSVSSDTPDHDADIESPQHADSYARLLQRSIPAINVRAPKSFAIYGSAQKYYENSFAYIYNSYPYDGSNHERVEWALSASAIDLAILQKEYPMATGSANFSSNGWGSIADTEGDYGKSSTPEYIKFSGGPYVGTVIDSDTRRESSLKIDPKQGGTIEFWMKKSAYPTTKTNREVIVDIYTDTEGESSNSYGRMQIAMDSQISQAFSVTYLSGSEGMLNSPIGQAANVRGFEIDGNWHHYAFSFIDKDSSLSCDFYMDGEYKERFAISTAGFGEFTAVNSHFKGTIGALGMDIDSSGASIGYGQLSASLDDVRVWKTARTAREINSYFDRSVVGATDNESIDSVLGLYYKFNESIVGAPTTDTIVVDYSGRLNNGEFVGYRDSTRSTESAITTADSTTNKEIGDPIINAESPLVKSKLLELKQIAKTHDKQNHASLFKTVPQWAFDTPAGSSNLESNFSILLQAIASKFDDIRLLIGGIPQINSPSAQSNYYEVSSDDYRSNFNSVLGAPKDFINNYEVLSERKFSFQNLASRGWNIGELPIVEKTSISEYFHNLGTDEHDAKVAGLPKLIHSKAEIVKEQILSSVYNNLSNIYTTKGTRHAFRNLIRCFGVDENLIIPNTYINNIEKEITNEPTFDAVKVKSLAFTGSSTGAVLYQTASSDTSERNYIDGKTDSTSFTVEGNFIFPKIANTSNTAITSSVFGINQVTDSDLWISSPNNAGISIKTFKSGLNREGSSFGLSSSAGLFEEVKSSYFQSVYDNTPWHLSVRLSENTGMPLNDYDNNISNDYKIEFLGHRYDMDVLTSKFHLSQSLTKTQYDSFMSGKKSIYAGARRTNITGSLLNLSDVKVVNIAAWDDYLEDEELREHAKGIENLGRLYNFYNHKDNKGSSRPKADSLILNWRFENSAFTNNKVSIVDASSGSLGDVETYGPIVGYKYPATTSTISSGLTIIDQEFLTSVEYVPIDNMHSRSKIEIKDREVDIFQLDSRPTTYLYTYEKSMYQVISREMLKMLAGVREFNNIIGEPVYKYRQKYKTLEKLRERFFSRIENDIDLDKFVEYYKWIDSSLGKMLENLQPATSAMKLGLEDVVESHAFERNKYQHKSPVFEFKDPKIEGNILAINELLYDWEHGHASLETEVKYASQPGEDIKAIVFPSNTTDLITVGDNNALSFDHAPGIYNNPPGSPDVDEAFIVGSSPSGAFVGQSNKVATWNGSSWVFTDYAGQGTINNPGVNAFTISAWARPYGYSNQGTHTLTFLMKTYEYSLKLKYTGAGPYYDPTELQFLIQDSSTTGTGNAGTRYIKSSAAATPFQNISENLFHHIVAVSDPTHEHKIRLYVDGVEYVVNGSTTTINTTGNGVTNMRDGPQDLKIGEGHRNNGYMADVAFFNKALSAAEITELYNDRSLFSLADDFSAASDMVAWWKMGENDAQGSEGIKDSVGTAHGTLGGNADIVTKTSSTQVTDIGNSTYSISYISWPTSEVDPVPYDSLLQSRNCLWWNDRAERTDLLKTDTTADADRETLRTRRNTIVSGSAYAIRKLTRPYRLGVERLRVLDQGSNRNSNKNKDLYKIINSGKEITLNKEDIYDFKKCDDTINPQKESIYTAKVNTEGTDGYFDADSDLMMPFTFYSSSTGTDFSNFKDNLSITNLHDDSLITLQGPFIRENVGGMPHRHVKIGTADDQRPEAFILSASNSRFVIKQPIGLKSIYSHGRNAFYNIRNIKTDTDNKVIGNYQKDYEIVLTNSRNLNNRSIADTGSLVITPKTADQILDIVDYKTPIRPRSEHIFVNRFSSPGGPETQAAYGRDKESEEYSIYNTINYRNLSIRQPLGLLEKEYSKQFGIRSGSSTQASIHMTNRNYFYYTGSDGELSRPDNRNVQHPIPQNDFGYSWITSSATNTKFDFVNKNSGFGHQHNFSVPDIADNSYLKSKESILFATASILGSHTSVVGGSSFGHSFGAALHPSFHTLGNFIPVDFVGLNTIIYEPIDLNSNSAGYDSLTWYNKPSSGLGLVQTNYINAAINDSHGDTTEDTVNPYGVAAVLNALIHHRQGPYGWPSWKQLRGAEHPIARAHRGSNTISRVFWGDAGDGSSSIHRSSTTPSMNAGYQRNNLGTSFESVYERARRLDGDSSETKSRITKNYKEIMVTNRFRPITVTIHGHAAPRGGVSTKDFEFGRGNDPRMPDFFKTRESTKKLTQTLRENSWNLDSYYYESISQPAGFTELEMQAGSINNPFMYFGHVSYRESFQNDISCFANQELVKDIKFIERLDHKSLDFLTVLIEENSNQEQKLIEVNYIEKIYPREINTYTKDARERQDFDFWGWKSSREKRSIILEGNITHKPVDLLLSSSNSKAFPTFLTANEKDYKKSFYGLYDAVDVSTDNSATLNVTAQIVASSWPLDSRKDFTANPVNLNDSYFISGASFLDSRDQGTRGEGVLQNDFSTFAMGYNGLYGTPPFATVYNRRIPQIYGANTYLAGEAKWEAADNILGPFYDSYKEYAFDSIRLIAQDHSIIPEFRISEFTEEILNGTRDYPEIGNDFLNLTGAIYHASPTELSVDGQFFKTYSNSDFLKYFSVVQEEVIDENNLDATRLTLKCKAAMKFLPYKGFYPAERALEISEIFNRNYLNVDELEINYRENMPMSRKDAEKYLKLRTKASKYSAEKVFTGPGILFNSIKTGVAVDYPVFTTDYSQALVNMPANYTIKKHATLKIPNTKSVTGSLINSTTDQGIPRLSGSIYRRVAFEDLLNPVNVHNLSVYDNEPHPSASLLYGNSFWNRVIERPPAFGGLNRPNLASTLGLDINNTSESFSNQMLPYTMAMQNFAAETVNFFLEDGQLATAVSKPIKQYFEKDTVNKMRVRITNANTVMYDRHSAFGPPVDDTGTGVEFAKYTPNSTPTSDFIELTFANPADNDNFNLDSVTSSGSMPVMTLIDLGIGVYESVDYVFYSNAASFSPGSHETPTQRYINVNGVSADNLAEAFRIAHGATFLPTTFDVTRSGAKIKIEANDAAGADSGTSIEYGNNFLSNIVLEPEAQFGGAAAVGDISYTRSTVADSHSHGYAPYVPPFLDPNSNPYVEITFRPTESKSYLAREIINSCSFEYHNFHTVPNNSDTNTNYKNAMALSASLNLGMCVELETDNANLVLTNNGAGGLLSDVESPVLIEEVSRYRTDQNDILSRWVIQTKWETPVLDFTNVTASAMDLATSTVNFVTGSPWKTRYWDSYYTQSAGKTTTPYLTASTGMWHQKGAPIPSFGPGSSKGYYLRVEDVARDNGQPGLAGVLGFNSEDNESRVYSLAKVNKRRRKLGTLESKKLLKEAIVAIPYVIDEANANQVQFVNFSMTPAAYYPQAKDNIDKIKRELGLMSISSHISTLEEYKELLRKYDVKSQTYMSDSPVNAIEYQLFMMEEYILPPQLDFLITGNTPYMMYFFQFKASMDSTDLSNVWQNLYPNSSNSTAKPRYSYPNKEFASRITPHNDVSYISHYLNTAQLNGTALSPTHNSHNLFSPLDGQNKTRWLVFKVKQRGIDNLEKIRMRSIDSRESNFQNPIDYVKESKTSLNEASIPKSLPGGEDFAHSKLQFNWPYDYFSFVELVKLDAKIDLYNYIRPPAPINAPVVGNISPGANTPGSTIEE